MGIQYSRIFNWLDGVLETKTAPLGGDDAEVAVGRVGTSTSAAAGDSLASLATKTTACLLVVLILSS